MLTYYPSRFEFSIQALVISEAVTLITPPGERDQRHHNGPR